jgi:hypothetical protein
MYDQVHLVTTYLFKDKHYLVEMKVKNGNSLDLYITDYTAENWQCVCLVFI